MQTEAVRHQGRRCRFSKRVAFPGARDALSHKRSVGQALDDPLRIRYQGMCECCTSAADRPVSCRASIQPPKPDTQSTGPLPSHNAIKARPDEQCRLITRWAPKPRQGLQGGRQVGVSSFPPRSRSDKRRKDVTYRAGQSRGCVAIRRGRPPKVRRSPKRLVGATVSGKRRSM